MSPKVILFCDFLKVKDKKHILNSLGYNATREGVEFNSSEDLKKLKITIDEKNAVKEETAMQQNLINKLLSLSKDLTQFEEFSNYEKNPNMYTASCFINASVDYAIEMDLTNEIYMKYISERPGVKIDEQSAHGLFDQLGPADLDSYIGEIQDHEGTVWRDIISLTRKDAIENDYDNNKSWNDLLSHQIHNKAELLGIPINDFRWCAAFHDEGHHPHVHVMYWDKKGRDGFQTKEAIEKFRSVLTNDIFKNELWIRNEYKSELRNILEDNVRLETQNLQKVGSNKISDYEKEILRIKLLNLSELLNDYGSKNYAYQSPATKLATNEIVSYLCTTKSIKPIFDRFIKSQVDIGSFYLKENLDEYAKDLSNKILNPQKGDRKVLHNIIVKAAYEVKNEKLQKDLLMRNAFSSLNMKLESGSIPKQIYLTNDAKRTGLINAIIKADFMQEKQTETIVKDLYSLIPEESLALETILGIKDKEDLFLMKDIKVLNAAYNENILATNSFLQANKIYDNNTLHASSKLFQGVLNILSSETATNEQLKERMWAIRREDEYMIKKSKLERK